jgi:ribose transport system ATP-binding protein
MDVVRVLRERQVAVVYVSHILQEVMTLSDEVTVLRDGRVVMEALPLADLTMPKILAAMLGEEEPHAANGAAPRAASIAAAIDAADTSGSELRFESVRVADALDGVGFTAKAGEIVGLAGLTGAGHMAALQLVTGQRRADAGTVVFPGGGRPPRSLRDAIASGVALVSGDRRRFGLMLDKPLWDNIAQVRAIALCRDGLLIRKRKLRALAKQHVSDLRIRTPSPDVPAGRLSGGNQQKVVFAKWLDAKPSIMVLDDPTRGVDVGAKAEMHALIRAAAAADAIILFNSTDLEELSSVCDRVLVFFQGRICAELSRDSLTVHNVLESMNTGGVPAAA